MLRPLLCTRPLLGEDCLPAAAKLLCLLLLLLLLVAVLLRLDCGGTSNLEARRRAPGLDLRRLREGETAALLHHVTVLDEVQVVANADLRVHPEPAPGALAPRRLAASAAAGELQATEELHPTCLLRLGVLADGRLPAIILGPKFMRPSVERLDVGRLWEAHLDDGVFRHARRGAPRRRDAVGHAEALEHRYKDDAEPGAIGVATVPDVGGVGHWLVHAPALGRSLDGHPPRLVSDLRLHFAPDLK
mmetsp:Transcript_32457/g.82028  ORF Transcript_32457/g.82028 Transcript_32457/m.82028 type:complete len:246 (+) Transcript_32457:262-999(+)